MLFLEKISNFIIGGLEDIFYRWGKFVALHPYPVILVSLALTALSGVGFIRFRQEHQANLLWIPAESPYNLNQDWLDVHYKKNRRDQLIIFAAENVLTPESLIQMYELQKAINQIEVNGKTFKDICTRVPIANLFHTDDKRRRRRETLVTEPIFDPTLSSDPVLDPTLNIKSALEDLEETVVKDETNYAEIWPDYYNNEEEEEEEANFWPDYDKNYSNEREEVELVQVVKPKIRINYELYGRKNKTGPKKSIKQLPRDIKCGIVTRLPEKCLQSSLLEIWRYKEDLIYSATQQEIIDAINLLETSPWFSYSMNYTSQLGGIVRNSTGHIIAAKGAQMYWNIAVPDDVELVHSQGSGVELELADATTLAWEEQMIQITLNISHPGVKVFPNAAKSFADVSANAIFFDAIKMAIGYLLMFIYTVLILGKLNTLELKFYLAITGIVSVGMGLIIAVGLSSAMGYPYTPMHSALPFLCLGIGIDDMFVIVQCWFNMKKEESDTLPLHEQIGLTLRHAGVAVTITTLTDVFAFGVGAVTRMPGLESFCVCTAIGLASIYILQVSFFTAFLSLDEKRIKSGRDGLIPCFVHKNYTAPAWTNFDLSDYVVSKYEWFLNSWIYKICIILTSFTLLGFGIWGCVCIRQKFDPILLLPADSYLRSWVSMHDDLYPNNGWEAEMYTGRLNHTNMEKMEEMTNKFQDLVDNKMYITGTNSWWRDLKTFAREQKNYSSWQSFANPEDFPMILSDFLFSESGTTYKGNFRWDGTLECGKPAPPIIASRFSFSFYIFDGPEEHIPAKRMVDSIVAEAGVSETAFTHVKIYAAWETDEIIGYELWRNIGLAMMCVALVTLVLIANIQICLFVVISVVLTLADIVGFLHFWGLTIDIISCITIVLAVGLCVDYSVHIGHAYLVAKGTRVEKSMASLRTIGSAVFNGGFTTFLALVLLGFSESQIFLTFFKVFVLTVVFGLFHGLILLPVVLSILGPVSKEDLMSGASSVIGSSESHLSSPTSSGPGSPARPGYANKGFMAENGISVISDSIDNPEKKRGFGKKASWDVESKY